MQNVFSIWPGKSKWHCFESKELGAKHLRRICTSRSIHPVPNTMQDVLSALRSTPNSLTHTIIDKLNNHFFFFIPSTECISQSQLELIMDTFDQTGAAGSMQPHTSREKILTYTRKIPVPDAQCMIPTCKIHCGSRTESETYTVLAPRTQFIASLFR
jgi:hypothetical protein